MRFRPRAASAGTLALLLCLSVAACEDEVVEPDQGALPEEIAALPPGIHPIVSIPDLGTASVGSTVLMRVHLHKVDVENDVASYQGVFGFDPAAVEIQSGSFPDGILGAWNQVEDGRIRFAGAAVEGIGDRAALELRARLKRLPRASDFSVELEELVAAERLEVIAQDVSAAATRTILTSVDMNHRARD